LEEFKGNRENLKKIELLASNSCDPQEHLRVEPAIEEFGKIKKI
jgi:hypothetical protein